MQQIFLFVIELCKFPFRLSAYHGKHKIWGRDMATHFLSKCSEKKGGLIRDSMPLKFIQKVKVMTNVKPDTFRCATFNSGNYRVSQFPPLRIYSR